MADKGYWTSPRRQDAMGPTLYSAIAREIDKKGKGRPAFKKAERGKVRGQLRSGGASP